MSEPQRALLQLTNCTIRFGGLTAVSTLNFEIGGEELVGLIGPNGAGKTTVFNVITGVYRPTEGDVSFSGESLVGRKPHQITAHGIARTFQNIRLFGSLSVADNVRVAFNRRTSCGIVRGLWRGRAFQVEESRVAAEVSEMLQIFHLEKFHDAPAKSLSYGDQRRLEIARALATKPRLLLLDEPAAGMNASEKIELMKLIQFIKDKYKIAILLVEHDMKVVMGICERIAVLDYGEKIAEGSPADVRKNPKVIAAYLGSEN